MKYILDASVAIAWELNEAETPQALQLRQQFLGGVLELIAPDVLLIECGHALTRAERRGVIAQGESNALLMQILNTQVKLKPSIPLIARAVALSSQHRVGVYDCLYLILAEDEHCQLITSDRKLLTTFPLATIDLSRL